MFGYFWFVNFFLGGWLMVLGGFYYLYLSKAIIFKYGLFISAGLFIEGYMLFDWLALFFFGVVMIISGSIFCYSMGYMEGDLGIVRFMYILLFFVFSMGLLIFMPNVISMLLGWDGLGLVSYCLVIYYQNYKSYGAGMITVLMNRVGDVGLLLSIGLMVELGGWGVFDYFSESVLGSVVLFLLFIAGITKSAQMPFSAWLPAAMAAPTPVSALVHSSTLVTAGVYLLIRVSPLMGSEICYLIFLLSVLTMFMAGLGAIFENDVKKMIALSTLSQLGLMMSIIGLGGYILAFIHLVIHAIFKSLMFLCAGFLIHQVSGTQDLRMLGGAGLYCPMVCFCLNVSNFSLCGVPFMSGFYSSDMIIESVVSFGGGFGGYLVLMLSCGLTAGYSFKMFKILCVNLVGYKSYENLGDLGFNMMIPMLFLGTFGVIGGSITFWGIFGGGVQVLGGFESIGVLVVVIFGGIVGMFVNDFAYANKDFIFFVSTMWFLSVMSPRVVKFPFLFSNTIIKVNEFGWDEFFGGGGSGELFSFSGGQLSYYQNSNVKIYLSGIFFWFVLLMLLC
uniref:NADH-ubiquinone oxidoreductase chain 5 n=1 Tax=Symphylella sp. YG-2006 TaxID=390856 RepID=B7S769_9MYRI|nr:NADH dehydrogenase subunit 5 [Symphylella sp. YG-2006]ABQ01738.1 NADH dehydrogenase subunit 5 [Symphylella sp. YG-2006]